MLNHKDLLQKACRSTRFLFLAALISIIFAGSGPAQSPDASPAPAEDRLYNGYRVNSTTEIGWRWRSIDGNENKYRSDLNYKQGFRLFDSNLLMQSESGKGKYFDSLLISNSGWGSDPTGNTLVNVEKTGIYKFRSNVRRIKYFSNLANHVTPVGQVGQHTDNTRRYFGDFDFSLFPLNERLRFNVGASFSDNEGPGTTSHRFSGDEFAVSSRINNSSEDYRVGLEGALLGFNWGVTQGLRMFSDKSSYESTANLGNNPTNNAVITSFTRSFPTTGRGFFTNFYATRTFAKRLDFTGRVIYADTTSVSSMNERTVGRDNSNNFIDQDLVIVSGDVRRLQTRADVGLTYTITENFRISNTLTMDQFSISGDEGLRQEVARRNAAGNPLAGTLASTIAFRANRYRRWVNTFEGDYQFNDRVGFHLGYRYTKRDVVVDGFNRNTLTPPSPTNPAVFGHEHENSTNSVIAGMKIKPMRNWAIFWSVDHGSADNVFTRLENYDYTNFKIRSRWNFNKFVLNLLALSKDNSNPSFSIVPLGNENFTTEIKTRSFGGSVDWMPNSNLSFNTGYTYRDLDSFTPILIPLGGPLTRGTSQFFIKDHYFNFDVSAKAGRRVSLFGSYRISRDAGQDEFSSAPQHIITSYPMNFQSPEFRVAFRINRNVDWNVGYQYFRYRDDFTPIQNYRAHLPYTSLRIYFGNGAADR